MEDVLQQIYQVVGDSWQKLDDMWHKIGHEPSSIQKRKATVQKHVQELLTDMVEEEGEKVSEKEKLLNELITEIAQLAKELTLDSSVVASAKNKVSGKTLLQAESIFQNIATDLRNRKGIRMEKYHTVNNQVLKLADEMGEDYGPYKIEFDGIPSDAQVAKLEQSLVHLQREKQRRQNLFKNIKKSLLKQFQYLERLPTSDLERLILSDEEIKPDSVIKVLSLKVLQELEDLDSNLKQQVASNTEEGGNLWQKIHELWSRLTVEEELQRAFEKVHKGVNCTMGDKKQMIFKPSILKGLQNELNRLEEEKRKNMALFITQVREELVRLWTKECFMENVESRFFNTNFYDLTDFQESDFVSDLYTEELLEKHEREVEYWRSFVERNRKLIDMIIKRDQMFSQYRELDQKSDDPSRLANRGGALLKEEKERRMLEKNIPKLENQLKQLSQQFQSTQDMGHGMKKFLVGVEEISDLIQSDWANFHDEKERRKESKKKDGPNNNNIGKTMMTTHLGNPGGRKRPMTPTSVQKVGLTSTTPKRYKPTTTPLTPMKTTFSTPFAPATGSAKKHIQSGNKPNAGPSSTSGKANASIIGSKRNAGMYAKRYFNDKPKFTTSLQNQASKISRKSIGNIRKGKTGYSSVTSTTNNTATSVDSWGIPKVIQQDKTHKPKEDSWGNPIVDAKPDNLSLDSWGNPKVEVKNLNFDFSALSREASIQDVTAKVGNDNFARPTTRSRNVASGSAVDKRKILTTKIPSRSGKKEKEQLDPATDFFPTVVSPVASYSEFTDHLLCQSTLNSSTVSTVMQARKILSGIPPVTHTTAITVTTPTKSDRNGGLTTYTPITKKPVLEDEIF